MLAPEETLGAKFAFRNPPLCAPVYRVLTTGAVCFDLCNQESTHKLKS